MFAEAASLDEAIVSGQRRIQTAKLKLIMLQALTCLAWRFEEHSSVDLATGRAPPIRCILAASFRAMLCCGLMYMFVSARSMLCSTESSFCMLSDICFSLIADAGNFVLDQFPKQNDAHPSPFCAQNGSYINATCANMLATQVPIPNAESMD